MTKIELEAKKTALAKNSTNSIPEETLKTEIKKSEEAYEKGLYTTQDEMRKRHPRI